MIFIIFLVLPLASALDLKLAFASAEAAPSKPNRPPQNLIDGKLSTLYHAAVDRGPYNPAWIKLKLTYQSRVSKVTIVNRYRKLPICQNFQQRLFTISKVQRRNGQLWEATRHWSFTSGANWEHDLWHHNIDKYRLSQRHCPDLFSALSKCFRADWVRLPLWCGIEC